MFMIGGVEAVAEAEARKAHERTASSGYLPPRGTSSARDAIGTRYVAF